ncbi:uncharacterized protein FOMMEDRAFT_32955, partial [Fomitiporia mediterranea MF3/22]|uniref:uncharacterized protein n=1 Tax=Fomitiporia mediterranea (strain MF3/22) TaxID=694068 RepID=UPI0004407CE3
ISCAWYSYMTPRFAEEKRKSWIVTFLSSAVMSLGSLPFLWDFVVSGGETAAVHHRPWISQAMCGSFQGFLFSDLIMGSIDYPRQLSPVIGWGHHIIYAILMPYITFRGWAHVFCLCLAMEIPTCFLASSFLWPRLRNDIVYAFIFFTTRIALHASLLIETLLPRGRNETVGGSFAPACLLACAFVMHTSWFVSSVKGIIRR